MYEPHQQTRGLGLWIRPNAREDACFELHCPGAPLPDEAVLHEVSLEHWGRARHAVQHAELVLFAGRGEQRGQVDLVPVDDLNAFALGIEIRGEPAPVRRLAQAVEHLRDLRVPDEHRVHAHPQRLGPGDLFAHRPVPVIGLAIGDEEDVLIGDPGLTPRGGRPIARQRSAGQRRDAAVPGQLALELIESHRQRGLVVGEPLALDARHALRHAVVLAREELAEALVDVLLGLGVELHVPHAHLVLLR
mmetsp:Transcript_15115/g.26958  ORF Transcript_15115/g.26958 Transcript_15115/m.26958 type:complete len:247 (+) Transcript_15115:249-989(+)